ncbi:hypothetical protein PFISCL1PPCAC_22810, partial [Pristionchus fissidentatus]
NNVALCTDKSTMVALDNSTEKHLTDEIRKALGGPLEQLGKSLCALHAWADEVLTAVVDCVEKPADADSKKKKEPRGSLGLQHLLSDAVKKFLTEHVSLLGAEGAAKVVRELETRIEDAGKEESVTRVYAHLLAHLVSRGANVMGYEKLRATIKDALARCAVGLWRRGIQDASYTLARVLAYLLLAERDYVEADDAVTGGGAAVWWTERVMGEEKKLKKNAFFAALTTLIESEKEREWSKVDLDSIEQGALTGVESVLTARWVFVDTVLCHLPSLAAKCSATVYDKLVRIVVRAHVEKGELAPLIDRLSASNDLPRATWPVLVSEAVACIQRVLESCRESRARLVVDGDASVSTEEQSRDEKHR